jgi:DNA-directed RNA polymerase subunit RPC12/RpoP
MYCEKCKKLFDDTEIRCPACGSKKIRKPQADDDCFLVEKEVLWGEMFADVLTQNKIPFFYKKALGAGLAAYVGPLLERYSFYVPYSQFSAAQSLVDELFSSFEDSTFPIQ